MDRLEVFKRASLCRNFDEVVFEKLQDKTIAYPTYLSVGQEFISATIAQTIYGMGIEPDIFIQHRGHATYLSFDGDVVQLIDELLGRKSGCGGGHIPTLIMKVTGKDWFELKPKYLTNKEVIINTPQSISDGSGELIDTEPLTSTHPLVTEHGFDFEFLNE